MRALIKAQERELAGTGTARMLRRRGMVPAIVYGNKEESEMIAIDAKTLLEETQKISFFNTLCDIQIGERSVQVIPKAVQRHPISGQLIHVDFMRINADTRVRVAIPVRFVNAEHSPAVKRRGVLNVIVHHLEIESPAYHIPKVIEVDLAGLEMHQSVHLSSLRLPEGARATHPKRDAIIVTTMAPSGGA